MKPPSRHLFRLLLFTSRALVKRIWDSPDLAGLTGPQFGVLGLLDQRGPLAPSEISELMIVSPANVTGLVGRLQRLHLVARRRQASDRRCLRIVLTAAGKETLEALAPLWEREVDRCFGVLTRGERQSLTSLLEKFARSFPRHPILQQDRKEAAP